MGLLSPPHYKLKIFFIFFPPPFFFFCEDLRGLPTLASSLGFSKTSILIVEVAAFGRVAPPPSESIRLRLRDPPSPDLVAFFLVFVTFL